MTRPPILTLCALAAGLLAGSLQGQTPLGKLVKGSTTAAPATETVDPLVVLSNELRQVTAELDAVRANEALAPRLDKLQSIRDRMEKRMELQRQLAQPTLSDDQAYPPVPTLGEYDPPYPLEVLDRLRLASRSRERGLEQQDTQLKATESEYKFAREQQRDKEHAMRALVDQTDPLPDRQQRIDRLKLDARAAEQEAETLQLELKLTRKRIAQIQSEQETVRDQIQSIGVSIAFSEVYYNEALFLIDQREASIKHQQGAVALEIQRAEQAATQTPGPLTRHSVLRRESEVLEEQLKLFGDFRTSWERRFALYRKEASTIELAEWREHAQQQITRFQRLLRLRKQQYETTAGRLAEESDDEVLKTLRSRLLNIIDFHMQSLQQAVDLNLNLLADYDLIYGSSAGPSQVWSKFQGVASTIWHYEIAALEDHPITVNKIVYALLLIFLGIRAAKWLSHTLVERLLGHLKVEESNVASISTLLFYVLAVIVAVVALGVANIPLTFFAILGGAVAIGVGFGSQNIINNFISGLILLIERPIRNGDMVDVTGTLGRVIRVGLRCTQVRTFQNVDIMVPNSAFLETNVINLTLSDDRYKADLSVGVAYGSDTVKVKELLLAAAKEHKAVLKSPPPDVQFTEFGDNALQFRLIVWIVMRQPRDRDQALSDLRFRIDKLFQEAGIVIAFPQRDIHLATQSPLDIRITRSKSDQSS